MISFMYHDVVPESGDTPSGFSGCEAERYRLTIPEFERHLDALDRAFASPPVANATEHGFGLRAADSWLLTFDDGGQSAATTVGPRLEQRGWRGWFFITTDQIDTTAFCSREQIRDLHARGHVIGSHTCSHPERISSCDRDRLLREWSESRRVLAEILSAPITAGSVPGGFYSRQVAVAAAQAGIKTLFTSEPTTGVAEVDGCLVLGRYAIFRGMPERDAAALGTSAFRRWRQSLFWNAKKVGKTVAGPVYKELRRRVLERQAADRR
jgi:peptidoglycan/xylan/chitin deacetylase (PgdA/CDA1 family)